MPDDRLIVGLDLPDAESARALVNRLGDAVGFYKLGLGLLAGGGLELARALKGEGRRVFLDLKLFDIGATVSAAVRGLAGRVGPDFLTVQGDPHVVRAAVAGRDAGGAATKVLAVTVLTSLDRGDLDEALVRDGAVADIVVERARRAFAAGADGVIASPHEAARDPGAARGGGAADRDAGGAAQGERRGGPEARRYPGRGGGGGRRPYRRRPAGLGGAGPGGGGTGDPRRDRGRRGLGAGDPRGGPFNSRERWQVGRGTDVRNADAGKNLRDVRLDALFGAPASAYQEASCAPDRRAEGPAR